METLPYTTRGLRNVEEKAFELKWTTMIAHWENKRVIKAH